MTRRQMQAVVGFANIAEDGVWGVSFSPDGRLEGTVLLKDKAITEARPRVDGVVVVGVSRGAVTGLR